MIYISSELLFIKLFTTTKIFSILTWLNINLKLSKIGCNQTRYVEQRHMLRMVATPREILCFSG